MTALPPDVRALLTAWAARPAPAVGGLTPQRVRDDELDVLALQRPPAALRSVEDVEVPGAAGPLAARLYRPREGRLPAMLFLHGGGFVIGRDGYDAPLRDLAEAGDCLLVAPGLRLAPEHPFPAAVDDALAVARWLARSAPSLGAASVSPGVGGDSSGGNLAAVTTLALTRDRIRPTFQLLIYPMLDATASSPSYDEFASGFGFSSDKARWYFDQYLSGGTDRRDPRVSPLFAGDVAGLPPTLIATAEADPLRDDGERYAERLAGAGVEVERRRYPGMIHGFFQMTGALEGARTLNHDLGAWIRARSGRPR
ncbi:MAG TPA: alpha/beta hydrolase [Solirubrobacteraceae bacterium]|jgi:acetyl esterase